jgi:hypothetical protein
MSTTPSQVPVPSEKPQDLLFNAGKIDEFVNSIINQYIDRFGVEHLTIAGINALAKLVIEQIKNDGAEAVSAIGWQELGDWALNLTISNRDQVVWYDNAWYKFIGEIPHTIAGLSPTDDGGIWSESNPDGKWVNIGDAALRSELHSVNGGQLVFDGVESLRDINLENFSIFRYVTSPFDTFNLKRVDGAEVDVSQYMRSLVADGNILAYLPPVKGVYIIGDVDLPLGFNIIGYSRKPYTVSASSSFNKCGSVIRKKAGAASIFNFRSGTTLSGLVFDGLDKLSPFMQRVAGTTELGNFRAIYCGFYRFSNAIGGNAGQYIGMQLSSCQMASNIRGVYNTIDSMFLGCTINANDDDGVNLQTGANDNSFVNCRMEWNGGNNFYAFGALNNTIIGELNDRAGKAGIACTGHAEVFVTGVRMRRNGRYAVANTSDNTHFRLEGDGSSLIINGVNTKIGADDTGGGQVSPQYSIYAGGASANMKLVVSGSDFEGSTGTHFYPATMPTNTRIIGNIGLNDVSTSGFDRVLNGSRFVYGLTKQVSGPGQAITIPLQQPAYNQTSRYPSREIQINARNTADGTDEVYSMKVAFSTESYGSRFIVLDEKSTPASRFGTTGAVVNIAITDLVADASSFNVVITPTDAKNREINVFLV